jgi:hypothetical protein
MVMAPTSTLMFAERVPLAQLADDAGGHGDELVVDGVEDVDALGGHAQLAGGGEGADEGVVDGLLEVGVVADDHRVLAAELEDDGGEVVDAGLEDALAVADRSGEDDLVDAGGDEGGAGGAVAGDELDEVDAVALGAQGLVEDLLDAGGGPGGPLADLHEGGVAGHDRGDRGGEHVLQREVPRADDADDAERVVLDAGRLVDQEAGGDLLRPEGLLGVGQVPAHGLAHGPQLDGGVLEGLAGVAGDHAAQLVAVLEDVVEDAADDAAALGEAGVAPGELGRAGALEAGQDLGPVHDRDLAEELAGGGVSAADRGALGGRRGEREGRAGRVHGGGTLPHSPGGDGDGGGARGPRGGVTGPTSSRSRAAGGPR